MRRKLAATVIALCLGVAGVATAADVTFVLNSGERQSGQLVYHTGTNIGLIQNGRERSFPVGDVAAIIYNDGDPNQNEIGQLPTSDNPPELERSLFHQVWWQFWKPPGEMRRHGCDIMLNLDAGTVGRARPCIVMSRDMLCYEPGERQRYGFSRARLRLVLLRQLQKRSLRRADGVIFLTEYAAKVITRVTGPLANVRVRFPTVVAVWTMPPPHTAVRAPKVSDEPAEFAL